MQCGKEKETTTGYHVEALYFTTGGEQAAVALSLSGIGLSTGSAVSPFEHHFIWPICAAMPDDSFTVTCRCLIES